MVDGLPALPYPPPAHPFRLRERAASKWFRVHEFDSASGKYGATDFNDSGRGDARFSPLRNPANGSVIPTLYIAATVEGAISELVLHDVPTPSTGHVHDWERDKAGLLHMSELEADMLLLADLQSQGLQAAGLEQWQMFGANGTDYPRTRAWALHVWSAMPKAQGLLWMSTRDNEGAVAMLFGDRVSPTQLRMATAPVPITSYEKQVLEILDRLGCSVALA